MSDLRLADHSSTDPTLQVPDIAWLRKTIRGALVLPDDPGYDRARKVWNEMVDKRPAAVIYCAESDDVVAAVNFARSRNLPVSVRAGGHNVAGCSVCNGGIVIDVSRMKRLQVDPVSRIARAQAGLSLGEFVAANQSFGLAPNVGATVDTSIAGLTLGGVLSTLVTTHRLRS